MNRTKRTIRMEVKYNSDEWDKVIFLSKKKCQYRKSRLSQRCGRSRKGHRAFGGLCA